MSTIRRRLLLLLVPGLIGVLVAGGAAVYLVAHNALERQLDARLETHAHTISSLVVFEPPRLVFTGDEGPARMLGSTYFELHTIHGELLKRSDNLESETLPARTLVERDADYVGGFEDIILPSGEAGRIVWAAFWPRIEADEDEDDSDEGDGEALPARAPEMLVAVAAVSREPVDRALATLLTTLFIVGGATALAGAGLTLFGVRVGLRPLHRLSQELSDVDAAHLTDRFDGSNVPGELVPVYRELNRMLDRVERTIERERSFADATAHELRTPLAELRAAAEVALRWPDPDQALTALREAHEIGCEMEHLVESLLVISRGNLDNGHASETAATKIPEMIDRFVREHGDTIARKNLNVSVQLNGQRPLAASNAVMEIITRNLISNAIHYTPPNGMILVHTDAAANGDPALVIENGPVELTDEDLQRLFEPFWQGDDARSDRRHIGLGLTVVSRTAEAAGLRISPDLAGNRLRMRIVEA